MSAPQQQQVEPRMRKMLLISPEFLAKLRGHGGHTKQAREKAVEALKAKLPADQRWLHFRKHLNKYLDLTHKERESFQIPILEQRKRAVKKNKTTPSALMKKRQFVLSPKTKRVQRKATRRVRRPLSSTTTSGADEPDEEEEEESERVARVSTVRRAAPPLHSTALPRFRPKISFTGT